jgi:hypothetical protein
MFLTARPIPMLFGVYYWRSSRGTTGVYFRKHLKLEMQCERKKNLLCFRGKIASSNFCRSHSVPGRELLLREMLEESTNKYRNKLREQWMVTSSGTTWILFDAFVVWQVICCKYVDKKAWEALGASGWGQKENISVETSTAKLRTSARTKCCNNSMTNWLKKLLLGIPPIPLWLLPSCHLWYWVYAGKFYDIHLLRNALRLRFIVRKDCCVARTSWNCQKIQHSTTMLFPRQCHQNHGRIKRYCTFLFKYIDLDDLFSKRYTRNNLYHVAPILFLAATRSAWGANDK